MRRALLLLILSILAISCSEKNTLQFNMQALPKYWVKLTKNEGKLVVFNPCNAANTFLSINKEGEKYSLAFNEGNKTFKMNVLESLQIVDTVFIKAKWEWNEAEKSQNLRFVWVNKQKGIGRWITQYSGGFTTNFTYVAADKQNDYEIVYEPCEACWGDACDEVVAEN